MLWFWTYLESTSGPIDPPTPHNARNLGKIPDFLEFVQNSRWAQRYERFVGCVVRLGQKFFPNIFKIIVQTNITRERTIKMRISRHKLVFLNFELLKNGAPSLNVHVPRFPKIQDFRTKKRGTFQCFFSIWGYGIFVCRLFWKVYDVFQLFMTLEPTPSGLWTFPGAVVGQYWADFFKNNVFFQKYRNRTGWDMHIQADIFRILRLWLIFYFSGR